MDIPLQFPPEFDHRSYRNRYPDLSGLRRAELKQHWLEKGRDERRNASTIEHRWQLLSTLQSANSLLEIGPFDNPSLESFRRPGLQIDYADYLSQESMVERAKALPNRNPAAIPMIRYVLSDGGYSQITDQYDAVISHHCVEHQPDLILHLLDVARLLRPGGVYLFTMPDQRRCCDRFLPPTHLIDVLSAHLEARTRPTLQALIEHKCFTVQPWRDAVNPVECLNEDFRASLDQALAEYQSHPYVDVHCWKFTNSRLRRLLRQLISLKYLPATTSFKSYNFNKEFAIVLSF